MEIVGAGYIILGLLGCWDVTSLLSFLFLFVVYVHFYFKFFSSLFGSVSPDVLVLSESFPIDDCSRLHSFPVVFSVSFVDHIIKHMQEALHRKYILGDSCLTSGWHSQPTEVVVSRLQKCLPSVFAPRFQCQGRILPDAENLPTHTYMHT